MSIVDNEKVKEVTNEINNIIKKLKSNLGKISEASEDTHISLNQLEKYQKATVRGSIKEIKNTEGENNYITRIWQEFNFDMTDLKTDLLALAEEENNMENETETINTKLQEIDGSMEIIAIYIANIESKLSATEVIDLISGNDIFSFNYKLQLLPKVMASDKENGNHWLYTTPILKTGEIEFSVRYRLTTYTGDYLSFYNPYGITYQAPLAKWIKDEEGEYIKTELTEKEKKEFIENTCDYYYSIMHEAETIYGDNFKNKISEYLKQTSFIYSEGFVAFTKASRQEIVVNIGYLKKHFNYTVAAYTHELGHAYDNAYFSNNTRITESESFLGVYEYVTKNYRNSDFLRDYAFTDEQEFFAECVGEYYNQNNFFNQFNSSDLKAIELNMTIDGKEYTTLYDYIDYLVNNA